MCSCGSQNKQRLFPYTALTFFFSPLFIPSVWIRPLVQMWKAQCNYLNNDMMRSIPMNTLSIINSEVILNLVGKSSGEKRRSLPWPCFSKRMVVSLFGCTSILALWLVLSRVISSRMVGIWRSECNTWLGTYHGALVTIRRILFCSLCNISMFDWDAVPHNGMLYVQIGFNMALYINSLLVRESLNFLPMIQYILFSINPNCLRLLWICGFQVSRRSKFIPRYLTDVSCGMSFRPDTSVVTRICIDERYFTWWWQFLPKPAAKYMIQRLMYRRVSREHVVEQFGVLHSDGKVRYSKSWRVIIVGIRCTLCLSMCADTFEDILPNWRLGIL